MVYGIMLITSILLTIVLVTLLAILSTSVNNKPNQSKKVKKDLQKIKDQINGK